MYNPPYFSNQQKQDIFDLVTQYSFATLISLDENNNPFVSHLPLIVETKDQAITKILGHCALRNPHATYLKNNPQATVIFHGPHTYISPTWYESSDVPTWNYCVVHIKGAVKLISDFTGICDVLKKTVHHYETGPEAWSFELPSDLEDPHALTSAIVAFELIPTSIDAKFKLSQNYSEADRLGVIKGLSNRNDDMSLAIKKMMGPR